MSAHKLREGFDHPIDIGIGQVWEERKGQLLGVETLCVRAQAALITLLGEHGVPVDRDVVHLYADARRAHALEDLATSPTEDADRVKVPGRVDAGALDRRTKTGDVGERLVVAGSDLGAAALEMREALELGQSQSRPDVGEPVVHAVLVDLLVPRPFVRSEERRVGKECRSRWAPYH